eukprot:Skav233688  [mRNA]  locus=scaffold1927:198356:205088:- [translate_table: standard]
MLSYLQGEIEGEAAVKNLPATQLQEFYEDPDYTVWIDYLMEFPDITVSQQLRSLEESRWLDSGTYRLKVSFMTYNQIYDVLTTTSVHFLFAISGLAARAYDGQLFQQVEQLGYVVRFKAFAAQPRLAIVTKTLTLVANDLTHFGIVFLSIFFTYVAMGMAFFGREVESFASFDRACLALLEALMGEFSVEEMELSGRPVAFFFFGTYMMAAVLLLLNMLIAILMDVYGQAWSLRSLWKFDALKGGSCMSCAGLDRKQAEEEMTAALEEFALEPCLA